MTKQRSERMSIFGGDDVQTVANEIYGGSSEIPDSGRVVARPTAIDQIWADVRQPRRAVPLNIRLHWNGNPAKVPTLLEQWHEVAMKVLGQDLFINLLLEGEGDGMDTDKFPSVAQDFMELVHLAHDIRTIGLTNAITVVESDDKLMIETGERRWLAYHLLHMHLGDEWAKIPAIKSNRGDSVWRQATENTGRRQLNAIGMARQLALLIMALRTDPKLNPTWTGYGEYDEIVKAGVSDRRYYAQVADGTVHRIPRGTAERLQGAMALGTEQLSQYRRLLRLTDDEYINDALWLRADVENWPESALRDIATLCAHTLTAVKVRQVIDRDGWTLDDLRALKDTLTTVKVPQPMMPVATPPMTQAPQPPEPQRPPVTSEWMHKGVFTKGGQMGKVVGVDGDWITVALEPDGKKHSFRQNDLTVIASSSGRPAASPAPAMQEYGYAIGDRVRTRTGHEGEVVGLSGRLISVRTKNGTTSHDHTLLTKLPPVQAAPHITEEMIEEDVDLEATSTAPEYREGWTETISGGQAPHPAFKFLDKRVRLENGNTGVVTTVEADWLLVTLDKGGTTLAHHSEVTEIGHKLPGIDTDKADSTSEPIPQRVIHLESTNWQFLYHMQAVAKLLNDGPTTLMLQDVIDMTDVRAKEMAAAGTLRPALDQSYEMLTLAVESWVRSTFPNVLTLIENAGS